eukprot:s1240_g8.t1
MPWRAAVAVAFASHAWCGSGACDFEEVTREFVESQASVLSDLPGPVILRGTFKELLPRAEKSSFLRSFSNETVLLTRNVEFQSMTGTKPESFSASIGDWVNSWDSHDSTRYIFSFLHDSVHHHLQQRLLEVFPIPDFLQKHSVSSRFMVLGSKTKGVALHQHFMSWLGLLAGAKRWLVFPPRLSTELEDFAHLHQPQEELAKLPGAMSCVQQEGDVVILPGGWWHATYDRKDWTLGLGAQQYNPNDDEQHYAASIGNVSFLKKVKATNALLKQAAEYGHTEAVQLLLKAPLEDTLHTACHKGHVPVVNLLLAHKAELNRLDDLGERAINSAVMAGHSQVELLQESLQCNVVTFGAIIGACEKGSQWRHSLRLLGRLQRDAEPNVIACSAVISACAKGDQWQLALQLVADVVETRLEPNVQTYTAAISSCREQWPRALQLLLEMQTSHLEANIITYSAVISCCPWQWALQLLVELEEGHLQSDVVLYNTVLRACEGQPSVVLALYSRLQQMGLADHVTYSTAINASGWQDAMLLLQQMHGQRMPGNVVVYNAGLKSCESSSAWQAAMKILEMMQAQRVPSDSITCSAAVSACRSAEQNDLALRIFWEMVAAKANVVSFTAAITACCDHRWPLALHLLSQLHDVDVVACNAAISAVSTTRFGEWALQLLHDMELQRIKANDKTYGALAKAFERGGGMVNVLVQHGADVNWRPHKKKEPLLHSAARFGHVPVIKALLESKAQLHRRLKGAGEAIHDAAHFGHVMALAELVKQKAQPFSKTSKGSTTPLDLAMEAGHQSVVRYLQELAARHSELLTPQSPQSWWPMEIPLLTTGTDDEILRCVLELSLQRVQLRGVSRRWMSVWRSFPSHWTVKFDPPSSPATLELEVNQAMSKLILTCELELHSGRRSTVARMDWVPSYFGSRNGHVLHELKNEDADATWRLASRIFQGWTGLTGTRCQRGIRRRAVALALSGEIGAVRSGPPAGGIPPMPHRLPKEQTPAIIAVGSAEKARGHAGDAYLDHPNNTVLESPFGLIEELLADEPWQLLTTCILLNKTGRAVVDRMLPEFLAICPGPQGLLDTAPEVLHRIFQPLGLHRKRARMLRRFSEEYMEAEREAEGDFIPLERVRRFHGVGKYASDAYEIFVLKQISTVQPTDVYLRWYREAALNTLEGNDAKDVAFQHLWRTRGREMKRSHGQNVPRFV